MARVAKKVKTKTAKKTASKTRVTASKAPSTLGLVKELRTTGVDSKYFGNEPNYAESQTQTSLIDALNWYSRFFGLKDAKEFIVAYAVKNCKPEIAKLVKKAPENLVVTSLGWIARMNLRGFILEDKYKSRLDDQIQRMVDYVKEEEKASKGVESEDKLSASRKNIQEVMRERANEAAAELEGLLDAYHDKGYPKEIDTKNKVMAEFQERNVLPQHIASVVKHWEKRLIEFKEVQAGKCPQLTEAYSYLSKAQLKNAIKFVESVIADLNGYVSIKQVAKKPRARKPVPVEKIVAKLKYCRTFKDPALKIDIVSLHPSKLHNSNEAWVYDTKKRKMHHYVADEYSKCLIVKGNTLIGFDKKESGMKTLRKPGEQIKALTGSKPAARKYFKEIKAVEAVPNGRFNSDMVILKAF